MYFTILLKLTNTFIHWFCSYLPSVANDGEHAGTNLRIFLSSSNAPSFMMSLIAADWLSLCSGPVLTATVVNEGDLLQTA